MITLTLPKEYQPTSSTSYEVLDASQLGIVKIFEILESPDLFGEVKHFKIIRADETDELFQDLIEQLSRKHVYAHSAVARIEKLLTADRKKIDSHVGIIEDDSPKKKNITLDSVNPFALGNAIALGDKKTAWTLFSEIMHYDNEAEKTHGLIWWKIKDMFTKRSSYSKEELVNLARKLVDVYHESRMGGIGMRERIEQFILTLPTPRSLTKK